jgi:hypothetical protein
MTQTTRSLQVAALAALLALTPFIASAQATTSPRGTAERVRGVWAEQREAFEQRKQEMSQLREEKREEMRTKLEERTRARAEAFGTRIFDGMTAALTRLEGLEGKIKERMDMLEAKGVDTAGSEDKLDAAEAQREKAEAAVSDAKEAFTAAVAGETSRQELMGIVKEAREELRVTRQAYVDVLVTLRADVKLRDTAAE